MAYAIMRTAKLKSVGAISSCEKHNERQRETINADEQRLSQNRVLIGDRDKSYVQSFQEITKDMRIRKNAVYGVEVFMSASPEAKFWTDKKAVSSWAYDSIRWLNDSFTKENVIKATLHLDETTPHIHAFVVPVYEKKLNCKHFLGGRNKLRALQTSYHKVVEKYGLERGIEGSKSKHQDVKRYYTALNQTVEQKLPDKKILENSKKYKAKIDDEYQKVMLQNLKLNLELEKLQGQLKSKQVEKEKWDEDKKKTVLERELEKFNKERNAKNENRTENGKIKDLNKEIEIVRKDLDKREMLKFLDRNPEIKKEIKNLIKVETREKNKSKNISKDRYKGREK